MNKSKPYCLLLVCLALVNASAFAAMNNDRYSNTITINGDADTYYPVVFSMGHDGLIYELNIGRTYGDAAPSSWYTATHKGSLVFKVNLVNTGWGGTPQVTDILKHEYQYATQVAKASYVAHRMKYAVWLRGGGAVYRLSGNLSSIISPEIFYSTGLVYDHSNDVHDESVSPVTTVSLGMIDYGSFYAKDGNFGIGTSSPDNKLDVKGTIRAEEIIVETGWADYVFEEGYYLPSLVEVESHIEKKGRLPGVPSAEEVAERGVSIGDSQRMLLQKIEELTLYVIQIQKEKDQQVSQLQNEIQTLKSQLESK